MAKSTIAVLALSVLAVQGAVLRSNDDTLSRKVRSCDPCEHKNGPPPPPMPPSPPALPPGPPPLPPGPPPPPPYFHTRQWSGYARTRDGSQQGVFSGAEAAATDGNQASGQAFSIASDNSGSSHGVQHGSNGIDNSYGRHQKYNGVDIPEPSISYGSAPQAQGQAQSGSARGDLGQDEQFGKYSSNSEAQSQASGDVSQQQQVQSFGHEGHAGAKPEPPATGGAYGQYQSQQSAQSDLNGALNLAQQGLQVPQPTGCSTCGKSNYAFSNAKSHSGSAVALSIGG